MSRWSVAFLAIGLLGQSPKLETIEGTWVDVVTEDGQKRELGRIVVRRQGDQWAGIATECRHQRDSHGRLQPSACEDFPFTGARFNGTTLLFSVEIDYDGTSVKRTLPMRFRLLGAQHAGLADTSGKIVLPHRFSKLLGH